MAAIIVTTNADTVDANDGVVSLREAVEQANALAGADTITFDASVFSGGAASVIRLVQGEIEITDAVTVDGSMGTQIVITGDKDDNDVTVVGSDITDVRASGAVLGDNSRIFNITALTADTTLKGLTLTGGRTSAYGTGRDDDTYYGGAIRSLSALTIIDSDISGNSTGGEYSYGGAIHAGAALTIQNSAITGNLTTGYSAGGGGIHVVGAAVVTDSTFSGNATFDYHARGGAILSRTTLSMTDSAVTGNATSRPDSCGGGISGGAVTLTRTTVSGNETSGSDTGRGAGIYAGSAILIDSSVTGNKINGGGEGGGITALVSVSLTNSTVSGNSTRFHEGGGIKSFGSVTLVNSTVSGNSTAGTQVGFSEGGGINADGTISLTNSIVAGNVTSGAGIGSDEMRAGALVLTGANIVGTTFSLDGTAQGGPVAISSIFATTVEVIDGKGIATGVFAGQAAFNGGHAQTIALKAEVTNPALDAASSALAEDARGGPRSVDLPGVGSAKTVDLGAFELQSLSQPATPQTFVVTTADDELDFAGPDATIESMGGANDLSLREAIHLANVATGTADTITFDATVFTGGAASLIRLVQGEIEITGAVTIDGSTGTNIVITGDKNNDDATVGTSDITDVAASYGGTANAPDDLLKDNSRIFNITSSTADTTLKSLTLTGGRTIADGEAGGAVYTQASLTILDSTVSGNSTAGFAAAGGGIAGAELTLTNTTLSNNSTSGGKGTGGGAAAYAIIMTNSTVSGNATRGESSGGGGIFAVYADVTGSTVSDNTTTGDNSSAGGVYAYHGHIHDSTVSANSTAGEYSFGGGIAGTELDLINSTVAGNSTTGYYSGGGGIAAAVAAYLTNTTVAGNSTSDPDSYGGGVYSRGGIELYNSTVTGNLAGGAGGGLYAFEGVIVANSIVLGNSSASGGAEIELFTGDVNDPPATFAAYGANIVGASTAAFDATNVNNVMNADPTVVFAQTTDIGGGVLAGVLADNGGLVKTVALKLISGNPALDASTGIPTPEDARGIVAFNLPGIGSEANDDTVRDLGAFELKDTPPTLNKNDVLTMAEGATSLIPSLKLDYSDVEQADAQLVYTITSLTAGTVLKNSVALGVNGTFTQDDINAGLIQFRHNGSEGTSAGFGFTLSDGFYTTTSAFAITVTPVNDAPVVTSGATGAVAENAPVSSVIYTATASDPDVGDSIAWTLTGADASRLTIGADGKVRLKTPANFESKASYIFNVVATDSAHASNSKAVAVSVTDVNEAPTALALTNKIAALAEKTSTASHLKIADIVITDDALGSETITLSGADAARFEIFNGDLYLKAGTTLDFETNPSLDVTVNVDDRTLGSGIELSRALSVSITDVLETLRGATPNADTLNGTTGADRIVALGGNDTINGGGGDDVIQGDAGVDRMTGGAGKDTFVFTALTDSGYRSSGSLTERGPLTDQAAIGQRDIITDFTPGTDKIDLLAIDANANVAGDQAFTFRGTGNFAGAGSLIYRIFDNAGTASDRTIIFADATGDGRSDFQIELTGLKVLTAGNFVL